MPSVGHVARPFFPLAEALELGAGRLTPRLYESTVRLGSVHPFRPAAQVLAFFSGVDISSSTVRRLTEPAGGAYEALQTDQLSAPSGETAKAVIQQVSVDGAMIPLVGSVWAEVKPVVIGAVQAVTDADSHSQVHSQPLSYFSRLSAAERCAELAWVEFERRGNRQTATVCAVTDGTPWIQAVIDANCPQAVRILDFPHALEHIAAAGRVV